MKRTIQSTSSVEKKTLRFVSALLFLTVLLAASVFATLSHAQIGGQGQSLEVSPPSQELSANPGETLTVKASIRNRSNKSLPVSARLEDFVATGSEGQVALTEKGPWAVSSWTTLAPTEFVLGAGEAKEVVATVNIPSSGAAGGRYGSFVFTVAGKAEGTAAALSQEIASLFLIDISGPREEKLDITSFTAPQFLEFGPVPFSIMYKNGGNVHLHPAGLIAITDMFGKKVADVVQVGTNVFPGAERKIDVTWDKKLLIGKFSAQAVIASGGTKNESITATTTFIVFPVRIAAIIVLVIVILFLLRKRLIKAFKVLAGK